MKDFLLEKLFYDIRYFDEAVKTGFDKGIKRVELDEVSDAEMRAAWMQTVADGEYHIFPPLQSGIPKDDGTLRMVYGNQPKDRLYLRGTERMLMDLTRATYIHKNCRSYLSGESCGKIVLDISSRIVTSQHGIVGFKVDLSKYFDSVPLVYVMDVFDRIERDYGKSAVIDVLREYYNDDRYLVKNPDGKSYRVERKFLSLKQGCAVAAWLADVLLYHIDEKLSELDGLFIRYCDDIIFIGSKYEQAMQILRDELEKMQLKLNPKKVEYIDADHWVTFLGFSIKGSEISLSPGGIKKFQHMIERATFKHTSKSNDIAVNTKRAVKAMYTGFEGYSWATRVLSVINVQHDIDVLNGFAMDCIRASVSGKHKVGGLGYVKSQKIGCINRGKGANVKANKERYPNIENYNTVRCMANVLRTDKAAYETLVRTML